MSLQQCNDHNCTVEYIVKSKALFLISATFCLHFLNYLYLMNSFVTFFSVTRTYVQVRWDVRGAFRILHKSQPRVMPEGKNCELIDF